MQFADDPILTDIRDLTEADAMGANGARTVAPIVKDLLMSEECFWYPERLVQFEHWAGHIPFAFWLVRALSPKVLVELGTHRGNSYCAFCQAISHLHLDTRAFAVDTWSGDLHMAAEVGLLEDLRLHHDARYASFSNLLQMTFDEAVAQFAPGSVDLLHIDGTHTYDSVRHDFLTWKPMLSARAVVLFHDINVRRENYGVWQLWDELKTQYPSFEFLHSYGLGVLIVGREVAPAIANLIGISTDPVALNHVRTFFATLGDRLSLSLQRDKAVAAVQNDHRIAAQQEEGSRLEAQRLEELLRAAKEEAAASLEKFELMQRSLDAAEHSEELLRVANEKIESMQRSLDAAERSGELLRVAKEEAAASLEKLEFMERRLDAAQRQANALKGRLGPADAQLSAALTQIESSRAEIASLRSSTSWRLTSPLRFVGGKLPAGARRLARSGLKLAWWTVTLQLGGRIRKRREARSGQVPAVPPSANSKSVLLYPKQYLPVAQLPDFFDCRTMTRNGRIAVVLHLHYDDLWDEIAEALHSIPEKFDLFISARRDIPQSLVRRIHAAIPDARILNFENRGRDVLPLVAMVNAGFLFEYELICKLHTKRSPHRSDGDFWRRSLIDGVLGDEALVRRIIGSFERDPDLGVVVADNQIYGFDDEHWAGNLTGVAELGAKIGIESVPPGALFPGGSIYWIRPFLLRQLAALNLTPANFEPEPLETDGTLPHALERLIGLVVADAGMRIEESSTLKAFEGAVPRKHLPNQKVIAYYLPQFHPVVENDKWWGTGFTEWANVTRATPLYRHHRQPRLPADLGFYDLRLPETQQAQADLARRYGVSAFCYYYYWFDGHKLLNRPIEQMLNSGTPNFPFLICWANEPWSRNWDGGNREVLLSQEYKPGWVKAFAADIAPLLRDARYVRHNGRPVLMIYRVMHIPDRANQFAELRACLAEHGVPEVHLCGGWFRLADDEECPQDPCEVGLDAYIEFPPHRLPTKDVTCSREDLVSDFSGKVYSYDAAVAASLAQSKPAKVHRAVMMGWDNTARRLSASYSFHGATPAKLRRWLRTLMQLEADAAALSDEAGDSMVFVNAWNEWAEGTYLEPDRDFGHGWLEAVSSASGCGVFGSA